jgi:hypothetical protein
MKTRAYWALRNGLSNGLLSAFLISIPIACTIYSASKSGSPRMVHFQKIVRLVRTSAGQNQSLTISYSLLDQLSSHLLTGNCQ